MYGNGVYWVHGLVWATSRMEHGRHDGGHPGNLAVGGVEVPLQVVVENPHAGREGQRQRQNQHGGHQHSPAPATVRGLGPRGSSFVVRPV